MGETSEKMVVSSDVEKSLIFGNMMKNRAPLCLCIEDIEYLGFIERFDEKTILVKTQSPFIGEVEGDHRVNFEHQNNYHYFDTDIQQIDENRFRLIIPKIIYKNIMRRYQRVDVRGRVFMKFRLVIRSQTQDYKDLSLLDEKILYQEVKKPRPSINDILQGIKQLVSDFSQRFQVKIFKPEDSYSLEEQIVVESKKIFLIYDVFEDRIRDRRRYNEQILTIGNAYEFLVSKRGDSIRIERSIEKKLETLLRDKRQMRIFSECYVPLLLEGEVVGYIRLINYIDYPLRIQPAYALRTAGYASLLVEALVKYNYFRLESGSECDIPVMNISAGGLLFQLEKHWLRQYLVLNAIIQMSIKFLSSKGSSPLNLAAPDLLKKPERQIEARGIIFRLEHKTSSYGIKFQEINQDDVEYIDDLVKRIRAEMK